MKADSRRLRFKRLTVGGDGVRVIDRKAVLLNIAEKRDREAAERGEGELSPRSQAEADAKKAVEEASYEPSRGPELELELELDLDLLVLVLVSALVLALALVLACAADATSFIWAVSIGPGAGPQLSWSLE